MTVDATLAFILMAGGVVGAQFGAMSGEKLKGEQLRFLLASLVLLVCLRMDWTLAVHPADTYTLSSAFGVHG